MRVLKFGGTSVGSSENIKKVIAILKDYHANGITFTSVFSAVGGVTNKLIEMAEMASCKDESYMTLLKAIEDQHYGIIRDLIPMKDQSSVFAYIKQKINELEDVLQGVFLVGELSKKSLDFVVSHGERLSVYILAAAAQENGLDAEFLDARTIIRTNSNFGFAKIDFVTTNKKIIDHYAKAKKIQFVTGFIASDEQGITTTLGRGGSDYTAAVLAAALNADETEIWTDVDGVMTADPRKVKNAFSLSAITYSEAMEMSHFGAKVIYPPTLQPVFTKKIPIRIKNTFNPTFVGTLISDKSGPENQMRVKGISSINDVSLVTVQGSGMVGVSGVSARLFGCLAQANINIILITQASSEHSITFAVSPGEGVRAKAAIDHEFELELETKKLEEIHIIKELSVVAIIGENMMNTPGISGKMFSALGRNGVNVAAIAQGSSELNVSAVIAKKDLSKAVNALHDSFFLSNARTINLFVVGPGLIGATLLEQIKEQAPHLKAHHSLNIKVVAVANSKKMVFDEEGINLETWKTQLEQSDEKSSFASFIEKMKSLNLPNSVFVDNTSNKEIAEHYHTVLNASISIVTPNKVANSGDFARYKLLKETAAKRGVKFMYETNVGAGLPVIGTLQGLMQSGDEIVKIEGVLSGSLSFIFNTYDGTTSFKEVVLKAKELGFTEPDPRDDLNGMDVARKILILAREAGYPMEPSDVKIENVLPQNCIEAPNVESFFEQLDNSDAVFNKLISDAKSKNEKLCFIATLENGKITVGLRAVDAQHPFNSLSGSDNMISYTTKRYLSNPLVIKGPGAGAEVTAAGVFADIIIISNFLS